MLKCQSWPMAYPSIIGTFRTQRHSSWMISARAELSDDLSERSLFEGKKERVKLATEHKRSLHYRNLGHVWSIISNSHFYILNNITHFSHTFSLIRISKNYKQPFSNYSTKHPLNNYGTNYTILWKDNNYTILEKYDNIIWVQLMYVDV